MCPRTLTDDVSIGGERYLAVVTRYLPLNRVENNQDNQGRKGVQG